MSDSEIFKGAVLCLCIGAIFGGIFVGAVVGTGTRDKWQAKVIDRGYGLYCPDTGEFAWKGECDDPSN